MKIDRKRIVHPASRSFDGAYFHPRLELLEERYLMHGGSQLEDAEETSTVTAWLKAGAVGTLAATQNAGVSTDPAVSGQWNTLASWTTEAVNAQLLATGKVQFWRYGQGTTLQWDPVTDTYSTPAQAVWNPFCGGASQLADGRIFVAGGHILGSDPAAGPKVGAPQAGIYDPFQNTWTNLPDMIAGRWYPSVITLANGDALVESGSIGGGNGKAEIPQVWSFSTNSWVTLSSAKLNDYLFPRNYVAPNGMVFDSGPGQTSRYLNTTGTGKWTTVTNMTFGDRFKGTAVMYGDGKILAVGGGATANDPATATAEVIDLNQPNPTWRPVGSLNFARKNFNATLLPDGSILATGGVSGPGADDKSTPVLPAEIWNPSTEQWTVVAGVTFPHWYHSTQLLLPDARVLVMGGVGENNAEIYSPAYLFHGARPTIAAAPTSIAYGKSFTIQTPDAANIGDVHIVRLGAATHSWNFDQRIEHLSFTQTTGGIRVSAPTNPNLAVAGYYMLFVLNSSGVPSVAKIIHVGATTLPGPASPAATSLSTSDTTAIARGVAGSQVAAIVASAPVNPSAQHAGTTATATFIASQIDQTVEALGKKNTLALRGREKLHDLVLGAAGTVGQAVDVVFDQGT